MGSLMDMFGAGASTRGLQQSFEPNTHYVG